MTGVPLRSVQLMLPKGAAALLQKLPGYERFDPLVHVLDMVRPGFGLKDAPRLWHEADGNLCFGVRPAVVCEMAVGKWRVLIPYDLVCTKHVDSKGASSESAFDELCHRLTKEFG